MNAVGMDVSKGKSTVAEMKSLGVVVASPFEISHNGQDQGRYGVYRKLL